MIKIIECKYVPKLKETVCLKCNSKLEYDENTDLIYGFSRFDLKPLKKYIECPLCKKRVYIEGEHNE